jgi:hypothetical protein
MSKYCSKECGIEAMERRLLPYAKQKAGLRLGTDERDEGVKREMKRLFSGVRVRKRREAVVLRVDDGTSTGTGADAAVKREPGVTDGITGASNRNKGLVLPPGMVVQSPGSRLASDLAALQHDLAETLCELQMRTRELSFHPRACGARQARGELERQARERAEVLFRLADADGRRGVGGMGRGRGTGRAGGRGGGRARWSPVPALPSNQPRDTTTNGREARLEQEAADDAA